MNKLSNEQIVEKLKNQFGDKVTKAYETYDMLTVHFERDVIHDALQYLKEDKELNFFFMADLCGMHYPFDKGHELGMVYMLHNMLTNTRIRVETFFPIEDPVIPTASDLWLAANWMERETYDFFGIIFEGHPDLRRILNMDEMDYFPMLKQYPMEDATRTDKNDAMFGR